MGQAQWRTSCGRGKGPSRAPRDVQQKVMSNSMVDTNGLTGKLLPSWSRQSAVIENIADFRSSFDPHQLRTPSSARTSVTLLESKAAVRHEYNISIASMLQPWDTSERCGSSIAAPEPVAKCGCNLDLATRRTRRRAVRRISPGRWDSYRSKHRRRIM